jgi:hypothetical protein
MPPLVAVSHGPNAGAPTSVWFVQVFNGAGKAVGVSTGIRAEAAKPRVPSTAEIERIRQQMLTLQKNWNPKAASTATRILRLIDIATTTSAAERHQKARQLPVTVTHSTPTDGRQGTVKDFVVAGQPRLRVFVPSSVVADAPDSDAADEPLSGPRASAQPEQCYYEGQWGDCATEQEIDDALWTLAGSESEQSYLESEYNAAEAQRQAYCNTYGCEDLNVAPAPAGPSADANCVAESVLAVGEFAGAVGARYSALGAISGHLSGAARLTAAALSWKVLLVVGATAVAAAAIYVVADCVMLMAQEPVETLVATLRSPAAIGARD